MRITATEKEESSEGIKYKICLDNEDSFYVSEDEYLKHGLYEKSEISQSEIDDILLSVNFSKAKEKAIIFLSYKFRTEKEVEMKLEEEGFDSNIIQQVLTELKAEGYINDMRYVRKYLHDRKKLNPKSKRMLIYELRKKGIRKEYILQGIEELKFDNILVAEELIEKKFKGMDFSQKKTEKRVYQYLMYRGFTETEIKSALRRLAERNITE